MTAAVDITNTPAGNVATTDVQAAINELDTEKAALAGASFTGGVTVTNGILTAAGTSTGTTAFVAPYNRISAFGGLAVSGQVLTVIAPGATLTPLVVKGAASQTDNLLVAQSSAGTVLASISPSGVVTAPSFTIGASGPTVTAGSVSPESAVTAPVGSLYLRTGGSTGTTLYIKESGAGNTGWTAVSSGGGGGSASSVTNTPAGSIAATNVQSALNELDTEKAALTGATFTGAVVAPLAFNAQTGTSYTTVLGDAGKLVELSNTSAITLTVPANSSVAYPVGTQINLLATNTGQVTVAGASGVTVNGAPGLKLRSRWSAATLIKRATDTWVLVGDIAA